MEIFWNFVMEPLHNLISNSFGLDGKMRNLERKIQLLRCRENDVNQELGASSEIQLGRKKKTEVVHNWLENVERTRIEFESLQQAVGETRFYSFSRVQLGRHVQRLIEEAEELDGKGNFSEGLTVEVLETRQVALCTTGIVGQTFQMNCETILRCLRNDEIPSVGIYGMGGVGKTTVMKHVHNKMLADPASFGKVYWVTVSQNFSIEKLQNDISRKLKFHLSSEDEEMTRAACLSQALERKGKFILILDDVWNPIPLDRVGIQVGVRQCKLILTTRSWEVCRKMVCQQKLKILPLPEEEAWELFTEKLGPDSKLTSEIIETAQSVAKSCAGLPLAIITMAASTRVASDIHDWRVALEEVKKPTMGLISGMESEVFPILEYSYNHLGNKKLQLCFLHCALYPEDEKIPRDELIDYFIVEGVIEKGKSRQAEFDMGHTVLNKLEKCCLLESSFPYDGRQGVKMHDLIREMALQIMREGEGGVMVKAGVKLSKIPEEVEWTEDLKKVSLMDNEITEIPVDRSPRCPSLSTLMLQNNHLQQIPNSFFVHFHGLRVLNLCHNSDLMELPKSIGDLGNLNALLLRGCKKIKHIPWLRKLRELTDLDLGRTGLTELPQGMEELLHLKCLCMDGTEIVGVIPSGILPRLSRLQSFITWGGMDLTLGVGVRPEEVMELKQLEVFQSRVCNLCDYNRFVASKWFDRLWKCRLLVTSLEKLEYDLLSIKYIPNFKTVVLNKCNLRRGGQDSWEDGILLPRDIQSLGIVDCSDTGSCLFDVFHSWNDATKLKEIEIDGCEEVKWVVKLLPSSDRVQLPSLEKLHLEGLVNMKGIFKWELGVISPPIPPCGGNESFSSLKQLHISHCPKMKVGLTVNCLLHLPILEVLYIYNCEQMEEMIGGGDEEEVGNLPILEDLYIYNCEQMEEIIGGGDDDDDDDEEEEVGNLPILEELYIYNCEQMEEIIGGGEEEEEEAAEGEGEGEEEEEEEAEGEGEGEEDNHSSNTNIAITLPKLRVLSLEYLPELKSIYRGKMICDSIQVIKFSCCERLKRLPIASSWSGGDTDGQETASPFPNLQEIRIHKEEEEWWKSVELVVDESVLQPFVVRHYDY